MSVAPDLMGRMDKQGDARRRDAGPGRDPNDVLSEPLRGVRTIEDLLGRCSGGVVLLTGAPGTGKTTTALGVVRAEVEGGMPLSGALVLAPSRVAAGRLRTTLGAAVGGTHTEPLVRTPASLAFAVLRHAAAAQGLPEPRLLTGAEQDAILRDLLRGHRNGDSPAPDWPEDLVGALGTRGLRDQLRDLLMRAVELGVDPEQLAAWGAQHRRPAWVAAAQVMQEYDQVSALSSPGAYDPAWICAAAAQILETDHRVAGAVLGHLQLLVVDDAQELTAAAARLVAAVHRPGRQVLLAGDGDSVVQGFRGASPERFADLARALAARTPGGSAADVVLRQVHGRSRGPAAATARVVGRVGVSSGAAHREPEVVRDEAGQVEVVALHTTAQEAAYVAQALRVAHLHDGAPWSQMAVLARSSAAHESVRRALRAASVPTHPSRGGLPLRADPATRPLLLAYEVVLGIMDGRAPALTPEVAVELVSSPLGRADPVALRRLRRALSRGVAAGGSSLGSEPTAAPPPTVAPQPAGSPAPSRPIADELLVTALLDPAWCTDPAVGDDGDLRPARRLAEILHAGIGLLSQGESGQVPPDAHHLLWSLWAASGLSRHWEAQTESGGAAGARADRQLDAVLVLFEAAEDFVTRWHRADPRGFLEHVSGLDVAPDTLAARSSLTQGVEVLTPFAAAGREWHTVAVVGVQEGVWPDLRLRDTLLGAQALVEVAHGRAAEGSAGVRAAHQQVLDDETRQFHVAVSRATTRLLVTAVSSTQEQPSMFLRLVDPHADTSRLVHVPPAPTLRTLVAGLRRDLVRAHRTGHSEERDRCADVLSALSAHDVSGADLAHWWDAHPPSSTGPRVAQGPVRVSPSKVQAFSECSLRWLLTHHGGDAAGAVASSVGTLVHDVIAEAPAAPADQLRGALARRWPELRMAVSWVSERERTRAEAMIEAFVTYRSAASSAGRELVGVELSGEVTVGRALVAGQVDRLERDAEGRYLVVDLKTGSTKPSRDEVASHPQLGAYQVAVQEGAFAEVTGPRPESGGAALAHLGKRAVRNGAPQLQPPLPTAQDPGWAHEMLRRTAEGMASESFPATVGVGCRTCTVRFSCPLQPEGDHQ